VSTERLPGASISARMKGTRSDPPVDECAAEEL
jgi:hypothetical protein